MRPYIIFASFLVAVAFLSFVIADYRIDLFGIAIAFGLLAASVDLCWGYTGILNLGPALFFGIGAYSVAVCRQNSISAQVGMLLGILISVLVAGTISLIVFRRRREIIQFGLICLALSLAMEQAMIALYDFTGGSNGITVAERPAIDLGVISFTLESRQSYLIYVCLASAAVIGILIYLCRSHFGLVLLSIQSDALKTELWGYNVLGFRLMVVCMSAAVGASAGALYVPVAGIAHPSVFGVTINVLVLVWVALGGQRSLLGPFFCAVALKLVEFELGIQFFSFYVLLVGLLLVSFVILYPQGLAGALPMLRARDPWLELKVK